MFSHASLDVVRLDRHLASFSLFLPLRRNNPNRFGRPSAWSFASVQSAPAVNKAHKRGHSAGKRRQFGSAVALELHPGPQPRSRARSPARHQLCESIQRHAPTDRNPADLPDSKTGRWKVRTRCVFPCVLIRCGSILCSTVLWRNDYVSRWMRRPCCCSPENPIGESGHQLLIHPISAERRIGKLETRHCEKDQATAAVK